MIRISMLDVSPAVVIQAVYNLRLLLVTNQRTICGGTSPALPGSATPYSVAGYVPSGSTDLESELLRIPFPDVVYCLQSD